MTNANELAITRNLIKARRNIAGIEPMANLIIHAELLYSAARELVERVTDLGIIYAEGHPQSDNDMMNETLKLVLQSATDVSNELLNHKDALPTIETMPADLRDYFREAY